MPKTCILLATLLAAVSTPAYAEPLTAVNPVLNEMAQELTECAAYFGAVAVGAENSDMPQLAKDYEKVRDRALERALIASSN